MRANAVLAAVLLSCAGCVSIHEGVNVERPLEMNAQQDVTKRCPVSPYPHRLLRLKAGAGAKVVTEGGRTVNTQADFDRLWVDLTLEPGQAFTPAGDGSNKPLVDWDAQLATFFPFKVENTCQRLVPALSAMQTDCLKVSFRFSHFWFKKDCSTATDYVVYVFLYPKTSLPMDNQWTDDPDGDGISNESEITVGTDPMDANSKP
jgi:hypothetical protein